MGNIGKIRTGVIGAGLMGQNHARVYSEISNLVGISDVDEEQGNLVAKRFGVEFYKDYRQMLSSVDAVTIAVPTILHREVAEEVASCGVNLLVEKPLAGDVKDAQAIISSAEKNGVILSVGHIERHNPVVSFLHKALKVGKWGNLVNMSARRVSRYPFRVKDIGVVHDLAVHDLDIMRYLSGGEINRVNAFGGSMESPNGDIDYASIILEFDNGILGHCDVSWLTPMKIRELVLTFNKAYVVADYMKQEVKVYQSSIAAPPSNLYKVDHDVKLDNINLEKKEPLKQELLNFLKSINQEEQLIVTGNDGLEVVKAADNIMKMLK